MLRSALATALALALCAPAGAASFTYRGHLQDGGQPAEGSYRLELRLFADPEGRQPLAAPVVVDEVPIKDGRFAVGVDFPDVPAHAHAGWLEVAVMSPEDGAFWPLPGKQAVALKAQICPESWALAGNASTNPEVNFLGTTDATPFEVRIQNVRGLRIEPSTVLQGGLPITANVIAGSRGNTVLAGVRGATIGGGGIPVDGSDSGVGIAFAPNRVTDHYGTVSGGADNTAGIETGHLSTARFATVSGGRGNRAIAEEATVAGGSSNVAGGVMSAVTGGHSNSAIGTYSTIGGGIANTVYGASGTIVGGAGNAVTGQAGTVGGGASNCAGGDYSWTGGRRAKVRMGTVPSSGGCNNVPVAPDTQGDAGTFVWADSTAADFVSSGRDQFLVRAGGGMGVGTNAPLSQLHVRTTVDAPGVAAEFNPALLVENDNPADFFTHGLYARVSGALGYAISARSTHASGSTRAIDASVSSPGGRAIHAASPAGGYAAFFEGGRVFSQGNVGIGVANPAFQLHLSLNSAAKPTSNTWTVSSDERLKTDIETLDGSLEKLLSLRGVSYRWRDPASMGGHHGVYAGLLAQNVEQVFPEWVGTDANGYKTVTVTGFEGLVAEALRELRTEKDAQIATLRTEHGAAIAALRAQQDAEVAALRAELAVLREMLAPALVSGAK